MQVTAYNSAEEMQEDLERTMRKADTWVKPFQAKITVGQYVLSVAEGEPVWSEILETYNEPRMQHYRFARAFSVFVPEGELGDIHVSQVITAVSKEDFETARANGWKIKDDEGASS